MTLRYLRNNWVRAGLVIGVLGCGPLLAIVLLAAIGLWPDPNPNPIGPGLMFFFSVWPALICLVIGWVQVLRAPLPPAPPRTASRATARATPGAASDGRRWFEHPFVKMAALLGGIGLVLYGVATLSRDQGRGPAACIVLGGIAIYWTFTGALPSWFRRR